MVVTQAPTKPGNREVSPYCQPLNHMEGLTLDRRLAQLEGVQTQQAVLIARLDQDRVLRKIHASALENLQSQQEHFRSMIQEQKQQIERLGQQNLQFQRELQQKEQQKPPMNAQDTADLIAGELQKFGEAAMFHTMQHCVQQEVQTVLQQQQQLKSDFCENGFLTDLKALKDLLAETREERAGMDEMIDNIKEVKLDVITMMHAFSMNKETAVAELKEVRGTTIDEFGELREKMRRELEEIRCAFAKMIEQNSTPRGPKAAGGSLSPSVQEADVTASLVSAARKLNTATKLSPRINEDLGRAEPLSLASDHSQAPTVSSPAVAAAAAIAAAATAAEAAAAAVTASPPATTLGLGTAQGLSLAVDLPAKENSFTSQDGGLLSASSAGYCVLSSPSPMQLVPPPYPSPAQFASGSSQKENTVPQTAESRRSPRGAVPTVCATYNPTVPQASTESRRSPSLQRTAGAVHSPVVPPPHRASECSPMERARSVGNSVLMGSQSLALRSTTEVWPPSKNKVGGSCRLPVAPAMVAPGVVRLATVST